MNRPSVIAAIFTILVGSSCYASPLVEDVLDVVEHHIAEAPDEDAANFLLKVGASFWERRERIATLAIAHLDDSDPAAVAGALSVLYRVRGYQPLEWIGGRSFEETNSAFLSDLDQKVLDRVESLSSLRDENVFRALSLYLGIARSPRSRAALRGIALRAKDTEQTLICLAWHRDAADMEFLLPYMLADTPAAASLPYHFRNSYGKSASPYLQAATQRAKSRFAREAAAVELRSLGQ